MRIEMAGVLSSLFSGAGLALYLERRRKAHIFALIAGRAPYRVREEEQAKTI